MKKNFQTAPFVEMALVRSAHAQNYDFDIIADDKLSLQEYCNALLKKIFELSSCDYPAFLNYQISLVKDPIDWLTKLEELISNNDYIFIEEKALSCYTKLYTLIEKKKDSLLLAQAKATKPLSKRRINAESEDRYFSFYELKKQIDSLDDDNEKILLLTKEKHDYRQANIEFINQKLPLFDVQCRHEITQIYELQTIKDTIQKFKPVQTGNSIQLTKLQFNCNVNQFVDIFYQLSSEILVEGKPIIEGNVHDIAEMIVNAFVDKDGREISLQSVKTILKPSREDKRPNNNKRIDLGKFP